LLCEKVQSLTVLEAVPHMEREALYDRTLGYETLHLRIQGRA
jgi:hypothetical protein